MAQGFDNPNPIADGALCYIRDLAGFRQLRQVKSVDPKQGGGIKEETGAAGVLGSTRTAGGFTITVVNVIARGVPDEVDYDGLHAADEIFTFEIQYLGNDRHVFDNCRVSTVSTPVTEDGTILRTVELHSTTRRIVKP